MQFEADVVDDRLALVAGMQTTDAQDRRTVGGVPAIAAHHDGLRGQLVGSDASHFVSGNNGDERRQLGATRVGDQFAAQRERTSRGPLPGCRCPSTETDDLPGTADIRRRGDEVTGVGVCRSGEDVGRGPVFDHTPGIHDGNGVGEIGDHRKVVGDVERCHAVGLGQ